MKNATNQLCDFVSFPNVRRVERETYQFPFLGKFVKTRFLRH